MSGGGRGEVVKREAVRLYGTGGLTRRGVRSPERMVVLDQSEEECQMRGIFDQTALNPSGFLLVPSC